LANSKGNITILPNGFLVNTTSLSFFPF
jgi:hypothetical protein